MTSTEFSALSAEAQVAALEGLGRAALDELGVRAENVRLLNHAENTTFFVGSPEGRFNLRISRPSYQSTSNIRSELAFISALAKAGFSVPKPWQDRLVTAKHNDVPEPRDCVLLLWQDGEFVKGPYSVGQAANLGRTMARLHEFVLSWSPPPDFDRQPYTDMFGKITEVSPNVNPDDFALVREVVLESRAKIANLPRDRDWWGLIHADLHHGNVLFEGENLHLIDFDDCHCDFWLADFSAALGYILPYPSYPEVRAALLKGYREIRPLPPETEVLLDDFLRYRLAQIAAWVLARNDNPTLRETGHEFVSTLCQRIRGLQRA